MSKVALLIGVSEYPEGEFSPLPKAVWDAEALGEVLKDPDLGEFDTVEVLKNPSKIQIETQLQTLFNLERNKEDLVLLFFSGHGIKDETGKLYFATCITHKMRNGALNKATAVDARFIHEAMSDCRSKRQIVILDCCYSGAFPHGLSLKDDGTIPLKTLLGGEGKAILTSSSSTQYSFEQVELSNSIYTHYFLEGIKTGAADLNNDGWLSIRGLHQYTKRKVQEMSPRMNPEIYTSKEGYDILLTKSPGVLSTLRYRQEVKQFMSRGKVSPVERFFLEALREKLHLSKIEAQKIEAEEEKYQAKLEKYEEVFIAQLQEDNLLGTKACADLKRLQKFLNLQDEEVSAIEERAKYQYEERVIKQNIKQEYDKESVIAPQEKPKEPVTSEQFKKFNVVTERFAKKILWVNDHPEDTWSERRVFESQGIEVVLALSTNEALELFKTNKFAAIISGTERTEVLQESYVLLEKLRSLGDKTPFFIYSGSNRPEHKKLARERGAMGSTNRADELFLLVKDATGLDLQKKRQDHGNLRKPRPLPSISSPVVIGTSFCDQLKDGSKGPEMVVIPAGKFKMGDDHGNADGKPAHWVTITYEFAVGRYPVTFAEYDKFCEAARREKPNDEGWGRGQHPVINVYWKDAKDYCQWLSEQTGKPYRLPSEAEWEYACRAGTTTQYSFGDGEKLLQHYAWYDRNSNGQTHPVEEKKPNPWGLYDMHGNIWEWCEDVWYDNYDSYDGAPTDGSAWVTGGEQKSRLLRGGSWYNGTYSCRSADRHRLDRKNRSSGFRLCVSVLR